MEYIFVVFTPYSSDWWIRPPATTLSPRPGRAEQEFPHPNPAQSLVKILLLFSVPAAAAGCGAAKQRLAKRWRKISAKSAHSVKVSLDAQRARPHLQIRNVYPATGRAQTESTSL